MLRPNIHLKLFNLVDMLGGFQIQNLRKICLSLHWKWFLLAFLFIVLGMPRFSILSAHWSSDEARWLRRSAQFMSAVKHGKFSETLIAYHPGVPTMWIAGLRTFFIEPHVDVQNLAIARWFLGIAVWIGLGLACVLLYRLSGGWTSVISFVFFTYSPFFLAQTRRVHTDALATVLTLLTVLSFLLYCGNRQKCRYLILSGFAFGLAILAKSYSLILLGWVPLCLFLYWKPHYEHVGKNIFANTVALLSFLGCALLTCLSLWPVFWNTTFGLLGLSLLGVTVVLLRILLKPLQRHKPAGALENDLQLSLHLCYILLLLAALVLVLVSVSAICVVRRVFDRVAWALTTPHEVEYFFLGQIVNDPGWFFYPFVLAIKSTPLMLPLTSFGVFILWKRRKNSDKIAQQFRLALALVTVVILFTVCLSGTSKKFARYLLPTFPILEILAAIGFVEFFQWSSTFLKTRFGTKGTGIRIIFPIIAVLCFFAIQVFPVLRLHPYYSTYYNIFWKVTDITKIISVGDGSGLDIAASYLNAKSNAEKLVVQVSPLATQIVRRYFKGLAYSVESRHAHGLIVDYEVVYIRDVQIARVPQKGTLNGQLEYVIPLNGIDHVWIYRVR